MKCGERGFAGRRNGRLAWRQKSREAQKWVNFTDVGADFGKSARVPIQSFIRPKSRQISTSAARKFLHKLHIPNGAVANHS